MTTVADKVVRVGSSPIHGRGVFAAVPVPAGAHIGTYEGTDTDEDGTYVLWVETNDGWKLIDGTGPLRWLNHSRSPNAEFDGSDLYAIVDIESGTEITFDYGPDWSEVD
jgi:SET domain-containing protein